MNRMRALRDRLEWSQATMADYVGLSQAQISNIENGTPEKGPLTMVLDQLARERGWPDLTAEAFRGNAAEAGSQPKDAA